MGRGAPDPEVARLAGLLVGRFDDLVDRLTDRIGAEIDIYRPGAVVEAAELRRSVRDNFEFMLGQISTSDEPDLSAPRHTGRLRAQQGAPLPEVLRAYRLGFAFLWEELLAEATRCGPAAVAALADTAATIWSHSDEYAVALTEAYREAVAERLLSTDRHRSALVEALITGGLPTTARRGRWPSCWSCPYRARSWWSRRRPPRWARNRWSGWRPGCGRTTSRRRGGCSRTPGRRGQLWSTPAGVVVDVLGKLAMARVGVSPSYSTLDQTPRARGWPGSPCRTCRPASRGSPSSTTARWAPWWPRTRRGPGRRAAGARPDPRARRGGSRHAAGHHRGLAGRRRLGHHGRPGPVLPPEHGALPAARVDELTGRSTDDPRAVAELAAALQALRVFPTLAELRRADRSRAAPSDR